MSTTLTFTDPDADAAAITAMSRDELTETGPELLRQSRKHEARTVLAGAYLNGEHSTNRVSIMARAAQRAGDIDLDGTEGEDAEMSFEKIVLNYASRATTDPVLAQELEAALISMNPDTVIEERDTITDLVENVTITAETAGHSTLDAVVLAHYGVFLTTQINALIDERTCRKDPRRLGALRVIALGEITGVPVAHLDCECGQDDCPKRGGGTDSNGSAETPADAEDAAAWDDLLPAPVDADVPDVELVEPVVEPGIPDPMDEPTPDEVPVAFGRALVVRGAPVLTVLTDPDGILVPRLQGYGPIDPDYATTLSDVAKTIHYPESARTAGPLIPQIADRPQAPPADPTGHGGHTVSPPGALTYAPSAALRAEVLANDAWCRFSYCGMPSHLCDLDHWRPFNHTDPQAGGWTVLGDLIPLCRADHQRKHLAEWVPTLLLDRRVQWRSRRTGQVIVTYPR